MSRLRLGLTFAEQLPAIVRDELEQLVASLQAWANVSGDQEIPGKLTVTGISTFLGQPRFAVFLDSGFSVPNSTEQPIAWRAPSSDETQFQEFSSGVSYVDSVVYLTEPGIYLLHARIRWDTNTGGTYRGLQYRIGGSDTDYTSFLPPNSLGLTQQLTSLIRITQRMLDQSTGVLGGKLAVKVEAVQDSGGTRTLSGGYFNLLKVA